MGSFIKILLSFSPNGGINILAYTPRCQKYETTFSLRWLKLKLFIPEINGFIDTYFNKPKIYGYITLLSVGCQEENKISETLTLN